MNIHDYKIEKRAKKIAQGVKTVGFVLGLLLTAGLLWLFAVVLLLI